MSSLYKLCNKSIKGDYFLIFDDLLKVIYNASRGRPKKERDRKKDIYRPRGEE
jgi:hypothetical protein